MTGFLNDLALSGASTDPNNMPEGKFPAFVSDLQVKQPKDKDGVTPPKALIISYKISHHDAEHQNKTKSEFKSLPRVPVTLPDGSRNPEATEEDIKNAAYLKQRLESLGVPEDQMDTMTRESLLGTPVWITLVQNGTYKNIRQVELREEDGTTGQL